MVHPEPIPSSASSITKAAPSEPMVNCDLCGLPAQVAPEAIRGGQILGLITCSACVEDALAARQLETFA